MNVWWQRRSMACTTTEAAFPAMSVARGRKGYPDTFSKVMDCSGWCVRGSTQEACWGDGICDDASTSHIDRNCAAVDFDGGDCGGAAESDALCDDTCVFSADGECDDGGVGPTWWFGDLGTDCTDCGPR